jgi:hypothetical protein
MFPAMLSPNLQCKPPTKLLSIIFLKQLSSPLTVKFSYLKTVRAKIWGYENTYQDCNAEICSFAIFVIFGMVQISTLK